MVNQKTILQQVPLWGKLTTVSAMVQFAMQAFFFFIGIYLLYVFIYGAYLIASAGTDEKLLEKGRNNIMFGAIGSVVIVGVWIVGRIINSTLHLGAPI